MRFGLTDTITVWVLCGIYSLLSFLPIVQLFWIIYRSGSGFTIEKTFLGFNIFTCIIRAVFFGVLVIIPVENFFVDSNNCVIFTILNGLPRATFYTSFSLLLVYWVEIIYIKQGGAFLWKRPFFIGNFVLYSVQITLWVLIFLYPKSPVNIPVIENYFFAGLSLLMSFFIHFCWWKTLPYT